MIYEQRIPPDGAEKVAWQATNHPPDKGQIIDMPGKDFPCGCAASDKSPA